MIVRVVVSLVAAVLTLRVNKKGHSVIGVAELTFLHSAPHEFPCRCNPALALLNDLRAPAQAIITNLSPVSCPGVVDRHQPIRPIPLKCPLGTVVDQAAVEIVG